MWVGIIIDQNLQSFFPQQFDLLAHRIPNVVVCAGRYLVSKYPAKGLDIDPGTGFAPTIVHPARAPPWQKRARCVDVGLQFYHHFRLSYGDFTTFCQLLVAFHLFEVGVNWGA